MKNIYLLLVCFVMFSACNKDDHPLVVTAKPTLLEYVSTDPQLTLFKAACERAGMLNDSTFAANGPYTLFAPIDSAMQVAGLTTDKISAYDPATLAGILQYHLLYGKLSSTTLIGFYTQVALSQNPTFRPTLIKNYFGIFLNGIPVIDANIIVGDGVVHKMGRVALPPTGTITQTIEAQPDLTLYYTVMQRLGTDQFMNLHNPMTASPASSGRADSTMTALVPTDAAMKTYGFKDVADVQQTDLAVLHRIFDYYFQPGTNFTAMLKNGATWYTPWFNIQTGLQRPYYIQQDGLSIKGNGNISLVHIIRPDILANNGVVQVIDQVLVP